MHYVYLLQSATGQHRYVGATTDLKPRLADHNRGKQSDTAPHAPWRLMAYIAFADTQAATALRGGRAARTAGDIGAENRGAERGDPPPENDAARTRPDRGSGAPGLAERQAGGVAQPRQAPRQSIERYLKSGSGHAFAHKHLWS